MKKLDKKTIEDILPLTPMQEGMLFHYLKNPGEEYYLEQLQLGISGEIDIERVEKAWNFTIETNEMLRTVFRWEKVESPIQIILKEHLLKPGFHDLSIKDNAEILTLIEEVKIDEREKALDLHWNIPFRVALCKTGGDKYEMIISNHHILYDGWSNGIILKEFFNAYEDYAAGKKPKELKKPGFKEFVKWIQGRDTAKQQEYWSRYLDGFDTRTDLSIKKRRNEKKGEKTKTIRISIAKDTTEELEGFVKRHKITLASLLYAGWGVLLQKYNNTDDVVFGTTVSGRPAKVQGIEETVGLFINTLPLRVRCTAGDMIGTLLNDINTSLLEREEHETVSLVEIKKSSRLKISEELFDSIVVIENYPLEKRLIGQKGKLSVNSYSMVESTHYDLTIGITLFGGIEISFVYREGVFDDRDMEYMSRHYLNVVRAMAEGPGDKISDIEIITAEEKNKILFEFNKTRVDYPLDKTIDGLFEEQSRRTPDAAALYWSYRSYRSNRTHRTYMTYKELSLESDRLAALLREKGVGPDTIAAIEMERSPELLAGILGILKAGGAYLPIDPGFPRERTRFMLADSNANILLAAQADGVEIIDVNTPVSPLSAACRATPANLAYIIYTSGSTGSPKGVMIEHRQLVNFVYHMYESWNRAFNRDDRCLSLTNITFDVSVCEFFLPLSFGCCIVLLPEEAKSDVMDLASAVLEQRISFAYIPPGLLRELAVELKTRGSRLYLDKMLVGVEPIPGEVLEEYLRLNPGMSIINGYGPTEATICSTSYRYNSHVPAGKTVPIGRPLSNTEIHLLDKDGHPVPVGVPGEIYISGAGVGRGYLNRPGLTSERFNVFYRTGDLGRWLPDGNIEFIGRVDGQVKIRGHRIESGEIENRLLRHPGVKKAVVTAREKENGDKYLCAYVVPHPDALLELSKLKKYLAGQLPRYMVPTFLVQLKEIPVTASGKINRNALPPPEMETGKEYTAPRDEIEKKLGTLWAETLNIKEEETGIDTDFFDSGGHSLIATRLISKIHKDLNAKISLDTLFQNPTIRELAGYIKKTGQKTGTDRYIPIPGAEKREYYPLSAAQKRLYITQHLELEGVVYNVQNIARLEGRISRERVETTFRRLIERHENFRTSFEVINDEPVQRIRERVEFEMVYLESMDEPDSLISRFVRPFDLSRPPLLRAGLIKMGEEDHLLMTDIHHIIADGVSMSVFVREFAALYRGEEPAPLHIQYKDFSLWQAERVGSPEGREILKRQEAYWLEELGGEIPRLNLPVDFARPVIQEYEGASLNVELDGETAALLKKMAVDTDTTPFMLLLSIFDVFLGKICDLEEVVVGTPAAGREHADLERVMGLFVNMLVHRSSPGAGKGFTDFLTEVKEKMLTAYANRDYPYEELVDGLSVTREAGRNSLFDVVFVWEDPDIEPGDITPLGTAAGKLTLTPFRFEKKKAMFDITLTVTEFRGKTNFMFNYKSSLFKRETIESMAGNFKEVLSAVMKNPGIKLGDIVVSHDLLAAGSNGLLEDGGDFGF